MKYLFILLIVGIVLIGRAAYVALQIKKPEKAGKYGANPKVAILVTAALGAACFIGGGIGFAVWGGSEKKELQPTPPQMTFEIDLGNFSDSEVNHQIINSVYAHFAERVRGNALVEKIIIKLRHYEPSTFDLFRQEDYGWYKELLIEVVISDADKNIYEGVPLMGNYLPYEFGGGKRPGMSTTKTLAAYFYGFTKDIINPGEEVFVDDDFYKIIDELELK